jgi:negative regulator of flagellin synthesis FlgM
MSVEIRGLTGKPITAGSNKKTSSTAGNAGAGTPSTGAAAAGDDTVSFTGSATQLQRLEAQIASLPIADAERVSNVQRSLATGSYQFEPEDAADNLLTQEREFAQADKPD